MNKLEKQKIDEIEKTIYRVNAYISLHFIGLQKKPTEEEWLTINDELARCIRQLRNLQ
jgi:hypothetical protein